MLTHQELQFGHVALSRSKGFDRHRCEPVVIGLMRENNPERYRFDNSKRESFCLFQYGLTGMGRFRDDRSGVESEMPPGRGFLVTSPSATSYWLPPDATWEFVYILYVGDMARYLTDELIQRHGHLYDLPVKSPPINLLLRLHQEAAVAPPDKHSASARLYAFLMELYRFVERPEGEELPEALQKAHQEARGRLDDPGLGIDDLARAAGYSRYHFSRLFRRHCGQSPYAWLLDLRLQRALDQLLQDREPIKQIAASVGFRDLPHFCNTFRRHFGFTPASVRRRGRGRQEPGGRATETC